MIPYLMAESQEKLKSLLMSGENDRKKPCLKLNIQKMKIMASGPISSWKIDVEKMKTVSTVDSYCSHEIKESCSLEEKLWQT